MRNSILMFRRHVGIVLGHLPLDFHRTARRIDCACELDQHAVAGRLDDAAAVAGDLGIDKRLAERLSVRQACVPRREPIKPAVTCDIRRQDSRQPPFHALAWQRQFPRSGQ